MTMFRAFARTPVLKGPGRADVDIAMSKWWAKKRPAEGQVCAVAHVIPLFIVLQNRNLPLVLQLLRNFFVVFITIIDCIILSISTN